MTLISYGRGLRLMIGISEGALALNGIERLGRIRVMPANPFTFEACLFNICTSNGYVFNCFCVLMVGWLAVWVV